MKIRYLLLFLIGVIFSPRIVKAAPVNTNFMDDNLYNCVVDAYNTKNGTTLGYDTNLTDEQLNTITSLDCNEKNISSAKGIEKLTSLTNLLLNKNDITNIDLSHNASLEKLYIVANKLTTIDLTHNTLLKYIALGENNITSIDLSHNPSLVALWMNNNNLNSINLTNNNVLEEVELQENNLTSIDMTHSTSLIKLNLFGNKLINIDLSYNSALKILKLNNNNLTNIDVSKNKLIEELNLNFNNIKYIDLSNNSALKKLEIANNNLIGIDLSKNLALEELKISDIDCLNVEKLTNLNLLTANNISSLNLGNIDATLQFVRTIDVSKALFEGKEYITNGNMKIYRTENANFCPPVYIETKVNSNSDKTISNNSSKSKKIVNPPTGIYANYLFAVLILGVTITTYILIKKIRMFSK